MEEAVALKVYHTDSSAVTPPQGSVTSPDSMEAPTVVCPQRVVSLGVNTVAAEQSSFEGAARIEGVLSGFCGVPQGAFGVPITRLSMQTTAFGGLPGTECLICRCKPGT